MAQMSLKALRVNAGMTQKAAAEAVGVSVVTIIKWERGERKPKINKLYELCKTYGCSLDDVKIG